jgi:LysM repeat protein
MRTKQWALFIGLNVIVSVLTTLGVLALRGGGERVIVVTATPSPLPLDQVPTAIPADQGAAPVASPSPSSAAGYTVQPGDTLSGIAFVLDVSLEDLLSANNLTEDSVINPGQVLIVPQGEQPTLAVSTPSPTPTTSTPSTPTRLPTATPTPPGPVQVRVQELLSPGELEREGVVLINRGRTVNLEGWTLGPAGGDLVYVFPRLTLAQGVPVTLYTIVGSDSPQSLHWGAEEAQWGESGVNIELRDAEGDLIATYTVP